MGEVRITDEMLKAATKAIIVQMQCYDFGHLLDDGNFVTTEVKINLLEARAKEAARAALSAALSGMAEPVAMTEREIVRLCSRVYDQQRTTDIWPLLNRGSGTAVLVAMRRAVEHALSIAAPPASEREEIERLREAARQVIAANQSFRESIAEFNAGDDPLDEAIDDLAAALNPEGK